MDELVTLLTQRTGLSPDQARQAIDTVLGYVKGRLPTPLASQMDAFLGQSAGGTTGTTGTAGSSAAGAEGELGGIAKELGGFLGR
ncbi:MAG: hypothetical protein M3R65_04395 [Gemmatimonadota bacterium]|nr:hypothetical protein [Gemmatimonadota bacterium]